MSNPTEKILIVNLAVSNIFLCLVTMPLNLVIMIHNYWPLGVEQVKKPLIYYINEYLIIIWKSNYNNNLIKKFNQKSCLLKGFI